MLWDIKRGQENGFPGPFAVLQAAKPPQAELPVGGPKARPRRLWRRRAEQTCEPRRERPERSEGQPQMRLVMNRQVSWCLNLNVNP